MEREYFVRSIERAMNVLKCFDSEHQEIGLLEFVDMLGLNKSTLYRILSNLVDGGFADINSEGKYVIGSEIVRLANISQNNDFLKHAAEDLLRHAAEVSGETAILTKYEQGKAICIDRIESSKVLKITSEIGRVVPLFRGATGKIIAAYLSEEEKTRCLAVQKKLFSNWENEESEEEFGEIRKAGYSITKSEVDDGVTAFAVPLLGNGSCVLGSISIAGPDFRFHEEVIEGFRESLMDEAQALSRRMGHI